MHVDGFDKPLVECTHVKVTGFYLDTEASFSYVRVQLGQVVDGSWRYVTAAEVKMQNTEADVFANKDADYAFNRFVSLTKTKAAGAGLMDELTASLYDWLLDTSFQGELVQ
jgi:hypothetical protein